MATYNKQMQRIVSEYRANGRPWPAGTKTIAAWAIETARWELPASAALSKCAEDLQAAMREEYITDQRGRKARKLHPATVTSSGVQHVLWDDIRTAPRSHMQLSFQQRRRGIVGDLRQLKLDVDCFNDTRTAEEPIQLDFDFTMDLAEIEAAEAA